MKDMEGNFLDQLSQKENNLHVHILHDVTILISYLGPRKSIRK
jgi:hypothetical protein